jgi:hypothetical protein
VAAGDERKYDLEVTMEDATSAPYSALLVDKEGSASSTDLMSVSGPEKPGREGSPGLCPGPAKGTALGTSLVVFAASGLNSLHRDSVAALKG